MLKPLLINQSATDASISIITFIAPTSFKTHKFAHVLDSLVRVSRRVEWKQLDTMGHVKMVTRRHKKAHIRNIMRMLASTTLHYFVCWMWIAQETFAQPEPSHHAPGVQFTSEQTVTHKTRCIACIEIRTRSIMHIDAASHLHSTQQSHDAELIPSAFLPASASTFNSLFKVLFIFPSWYLYTIGFEFICSLNWNLPTHLRSNPEERDS